MSKSNQAGIRNINEDFFSILWDCKIYFLNFLIISFVVWFSGQGKDLLVGITENEGFSGFLLITLFVLGLIFIAMINWHTPRHNYVNNIEINKIEIKDQKRWFRKVWRYLFPRTSSGHRDKNLLSEYKKNSVIVPRWIGTMTIQSVGFAILNTYIQNEVSTTGFWVNNIFYFFLIAAVLTFFFLKYLERFYEYASEQAEHRIETVIYWGILISVLLLFTKLRPERLPLLGIAILIISFLFALIVTIRTKDNKLFKFFNEWLIVKWLFPKPIPMSHTISFVTIILSIVFLAINFWTVNLNGFYPLLILFLALIFYTSLLNNIIYIIRMRYKRFNKVFFLILIAAIFVISERSSDYHNVRLVPSSTTADERDSLGQYFESWVNANSDYISEYLSDPTREREKFPVFLCANEGGGSRAAYWTNLVLTNLYASTDKRFLKHCFAMSSASGGTFGSASFTTYLEDSISLHQKVEIESFQKRVDDIHRRNYLSRSLANLFGKDMIKYLFVGLIGGDDRAKLQEIDWSKGVEMGIRNNPDVKKEDLDEYLFERPFLSYWYESKTGNYRKPLLFINTTEVQRGIRGVISPVKMHFSSGIDMLGEIHETNYGQGQSLKMSTSALLSARFPFVNPGGKIESVGTFVDGGYYDNIGGTTILEVLNECKKTIANSQDSLMQKIEFHLIMITNSDVSNDSLSARFNQILIPPATIIATQSGHTKYFKQELIEHFAENSFHHIAIDHENTRIEIGAKRFDNKMLKPLFGTKEYKPIIPLARYISDSAAKGIQANIKLNCTQLDKLSRLMKGDGGFCDLK